MRVLTPTAVNSTQSYTGATIRQVGGFVRFNGVSDHEAVLTVDTSDMLISMYVNCMTHPTPQVNPVEHSLQPIVGDFGASNYPLNTPLVPVPVPIPTITFTLTAYFYDPVLFPPVVVWTETTTDPYGGFTLPRTNFKMALNTQSDIVYMDLVATSPDCTFVYTPASFIRVSVFYPPSINSTISTIPPVSYNPNNLPVINDIGLYQDTSQDYNIPIHSWVVSSQPLAFVGDIPGISITPDLKVKYDINACYNGVAYIIAINNDEHIKSAMSININVAATPQINPLPSSITYSMTDTVFSYPLSYNANAGQLTWSLSLATTPVPSWLIISRNGVIIVLRGGTIYDTLTVTATNSAGGISAPVTTFLSVAQTPYIAPVTGGVISHVSTTQYSFTLPIETLPLTVSNDALIPDSTGSVTVPDNGLVTLSGGAFFEGNTLTIMGSMIITGESYVIAKNVIINYDGAPVSNIIPMTFARLYILVWSISTIPPEYSILIDSISGNITVATNQYIPSLPITITATNRAGGYSSTTFNLRVAQCPVINPSTTTIQSNVQGIIYTQQLTQSALGTGPLQWSLTYTQAVLSNGFISLSSDGILRVSLARGYVINSINVTVTNPFGGSASAIYSIELYQQPIIAQPTIVQTLPSVLTTDYTYAMIDNAAPNSGTVTWSLTTTSSVSPLFINPTTGIISYSADSTALVYEYVTVTAHGPLDPPTNLTFFVNIQRTPVFIATNLNGLPYPYYLTTVLKTNTNTTINLPALLQVNMTGIYALTWSLRCVTASAIFNSIVKLDSLTGDLTVVYNNQFDKIVTVTAANDAGGSESITFEWKVAQAVNLINPGRLVETTNKLNYTYTLFQDAINIGPITWSVYPLISCLSIPDPTEGTLQVLKNNYVNQDVTVSTLSSLTGDVQSSTFTLCIAQQPVLTNPGPITAVMYGTQNFQYNISTNLSSGPENGTGPLTWHITSFPSLFIGNNGIIVYEYNNSIDSDITVTAFTVTGAKTSQTFHLNVSPATVLLDNNTITANMNFMTPFVFSMARFVSGGGNTSTWTLTPANPLNYPLPADGVVTINRISGDITVQYNNRVRQEYTVTLIQTIFVNGVAQNVTQTKTFMLNVAQNPVFVFDSILYSHSFPTISAQNYVLDLNTFLHGTGTGTITWALSPAPAGMSVNNAGILTILSSTKYFNGSINLVVTNETGGSIKPQTTFVIAQTPVFGSINPIIQTVQNDDEYVSSPIPVITPIDSTGPLTWTIQSAGVPPNLTVDAQGCIHVAAYTFIEAAAGITIRATNSAGGYVEQAISIVVVRSVILTPPPNNAIYLRYEDTTPLSYQVQQSRVGAGTLSWTIAPAVPVTGLAIASSTGVVNLPASSQVYTSVTVSASNSAGTVQTVSFNINKISVPVFNAIPDIIVVASTQTAYTLNVQEATKLTGVLVWQITSLPGLSIAPNNNSSATVTLQVGNWIAQKVTVTATNAIGESGEITFVMKIAQAPLLVSTPVNVTSTSLTNFQYQVPVTQPYSQIGPLAWTLSGNPASISIDSTLGIITIQYGSYFAGNVNVTAISIGGGSTTIILNMNVYFAFVYPSILQSGLVINRAPGTISPYTGISAAVASQAAGTGQLTWTIQTSVPSDIPKLSIDANGVISYAADSYMYQAQITVTAGNPQFYLNTFVFMMTVATTPVINSPGSLYLTGTSVRGFQYAFSNIANNTGNVVWETSELDGLSINSYTGVMTYDNSNIVDQNIQYLTDTSTLSNINTAALASNFVPNAVASNILLSSPYLYVADSCTWRYTSNQNQVPQLVMNQQQGSTTFSFPTNVIWARQFDVIATNAALGYDKKTVTLNLDGIRVPIPLESILSLKSVANTSNQYTIASSDTNRGKTLPPNFLPSSITGGTTLTFTWATRPVSDIYFVWTPSTLMSTILGPVYYPLNSPSSSISVSGFTVSTPYLFEFTCMPSSSTIANVLTMSNTPAYKTVTATLQASGATSVTLSWNIADILTNAPITTAVSITWIPQTYTNQPVNLFAGITTTTISGFLPNTQYVFTLQVYQDAAGVYAGTTKSLTYTTNYLQPTISVPPLQTYYTGTTTIVTLYINFVSPVTSTVIVLTPSDLLYPIVTVLVPYGQSYVTLGRDITTQLVLGQQYSVQYRFAADASGVYGPTQINLPSVSAPAYLVIKNDIVVTTGTPTGGTKITLYWTVSQPAPSTISWSDGHGNTGFDNVAAGLSQFTSSGGITGFAVGTPYTFTLTFAETAGYASYSVTMVPYTPVYLPANVLINTPQPIDSGTVLLSWTFLTPASSGSIKYSPPVTSTTVQAPDVVLQVAATNTTVSAVNLKLGNNYIFYYMFNPDQSGIYSAYPSLGYSLQSYIHKTHTISPVITITGGTTLQFVWTLYAVAYDGTHIKVEGAGATLSWSPSTVNLSHQDTIWTSGVKISGFTYDNITRYRFTFNFQETALTLPTSYVYPPIGHLGILPTYYAATVT